MRFIPAFALILLTSACANDGSTPTIDNKAIGGAIGAVAGGLIGTQIGKGRGRTAAIIGGAVLGGLIGSQFAQYLTEEDKQLAEAQAQKALAAPVGTEHTWNNPQSGNSGTVVTRATTISTVASECRIVDLGYATTGGSGSDAPKTMCRGEDGVWALQAV